MLTIKPLAETAENALDMASEYSPYLAKLSKLISAKGMPVNPAGLYAHSLAICNDMAVDDPDTQAMLRSAKAAAHYAIAGSDLAGLRSVPEIIDNITRFADAATASALRHALHKAGLEEKGLFLVALGKMGAFELNYSSDIDMVAFVDVDIFDGGTREPVDAASRAIKEAMRLLHERTSDGYVFRTDLRLRPDPSSTPLAVSTRRAELYYESVGQNWERMVWIKARPCAGDIEAGEQFTRMLEPFVWRRHLDYWAINDVHAIKGMINAKAGDKSLDDVAADVKLGPGGIREIEFFVQTQQIILAGRNPQLRVRGTLQGLEALTELGVVEPSVSTELSQAYLTLRAVEHRIQMIDDEQTHTLPSFEAKRASVAALCGHSELEAFDAALIETRRLVHRHYVELFAQDASTSSATQYGNLVFTGVDDDPGTVQTLSEMGFDSPALVIESIRQWHRGRTPATRSTRGRELLTAILPDLLSAMGKTGEPDEAFRRFSRFFEGLRSGVQTLSMLAAETELMEDLVTTLAIAPRIADTLAKRPGLLEALLSVSDRKEAPRIDDETDFEAALDLVRRWHGERAFLIGHRLLHGKLEAKAAAEKWTELADICLKLMASAAEKETIKRYGNAPGAWCVAALGKLGGSEMTAGSDLDLVVIYDPNTDEDAQVWFTRFTQRLIAGLSSETAEGALYEVDMRLRPSGRAGPVATSVQAFERYHNTEAWTWEHMALTRLRPIAGDEELGQRIVMIAREANRTGDNQAQTRDILDMRERLKRDKPASGLWDLKMRDGGLVDLEFIVQHALLTRTEFKRHVPRLADAIRGIVETGHFSKEEGEQLVASFRFLQSLQQLQRIAIGASADTSDVSSGLADRMCRAIGVADFSTLEAQLEQVCAAVSALFHEKLGNRATET